MKRFNTFTIAVASVLFAFTVMSGGVAGAVPVITNGLVAAYEFNGNADDVSGNGNNGVVIGATLTTNRFGNVNSAYSFDGVDDFIDVPTSASIELESGDLTISMWVQIVGPDTQSYHLIEKFINSEFSSVVARGFILHTLDNATKPGAAGITRFCVANSGIGGRSCFDSSTNIVDGKLHHVAVTKSALNNVEIFIDGQNDNAVLDHTNLHLLAPAASMNIGRQRDIELLGEHSNFLDGLIDDVYIYDRALSSTEVSQLYAAPSVAGANLIVNGDFESGNIGFATAYQLPGGCCAEGSYAITADPQLLHGGAVPYGDHSTGSGLMMVANGSTIANTLLWSQTVSVVPNTDYVFSAYVSSWWLGSPAELDLRMETMGSVVSTFTAPTQTALWQEWSVILNSGAGNSLNINIVNRNIAAFANDFAIDDISLTAAACTFIGAFTPSTASLATTQDNYCEDWFGISQPNENLQDALLTWTDLTNANFAGSLLFNVDFTNALLTNASLFNARFEGAILSSADLTGADLSFATMTGAFYDESTVFPSGNTYETAQTGLDADQRPWEAGMIPVPEPGFGITLIIGSGLIGMSLRRRTTSKSL